MKEEKSDKKALLENVRLVINTACRVVAFPENVKHSIDNEGRVIISLNYSKPDIGEMNLQYTLPENRLAEILEKDAIKFCSEVSINEAEQASRLLLNARLTAFLRSLPIEIEQSFDDLWDIANLLYDGLAKKGKSIETLPREKQTELANEFADKRRAKAKKVIEEFLELKGETTLHWNSLQNIISYFYDLLLPKWQEAKRIYKQNAKEEHWQVKVDESIDIHLPGDLLTRLSNLDMYESEPSYIAALHSARICMMPEKGRFSIKDPRGFEKRINKSRKWMKENIEQTSTLIYMVEEKAERIRMRTPWEVISKIFLFPQQIKDFYLENSSYFDNFFYLSYLKKLSKELDM